MDSPRVDLSSQSSNLTPCGVNSQTVTPPSALSENPALNSYKFSRPRVYVKNCFESDDISELGHLKYISENIGPKSRTPAYNQFIDWQLQAYRPKKGKRSKPKEVSVHNIDFSSPSLKLLEFSIGKVPIEALVDTGATHCLMSVDTFRKLNLSFQPMNMPMKVAGGVLQDNIIGLTSVVMTFPSEKGEVKLPTDFLVAHATNGYQAIVGASILMNHEIVLAITPSYLCLTEEYGNFNAPLKSATKGMQGNHMQCDVKPSPSLSVPVTEKVGTIHSLNCEAEPTTGSSEAYDAAESIDEQIIAEHQLLDPSDLNKRFKYTDCEINPNLNPEIRERLDKILYENQSVFAKSKLDVGKFTEFEVSLLIDAEIPAEKQRFMSDEKLAYCKTTFKEFEHMGLVEECHSPKTVSNLLLVPKYEGLRDLTKASVYLAQVKGEKNSSFRIVQDLRRINAKTINVKKALPKLPEFIFQKLKNKVVSSIDANQAYWHLTLDNESRSYTAFYLQNRILQFCRMPQGLASAPACWDEAMSRIFSPRTMSRVKARLSPREAAQLPDSFESFFDYYQDDSWIFSDDDESHLIHLKAVLMAYRMYDIRLSPNKCTFYPESFKILGVTLSPKSCELALSRVKAQSILDWEKPDSLYTLQSRLYALNYWMKFIPALAELKFPLQQIVRSQIFTWNEEADLAWQRLKALIALDIRLTIPEREEQLVITTDASKIACSCILWVSRGDTLRVVGCYSKLFSHTDSLKSIHFKETYALVLAFEHFKAYLLNTQKSVIVFTDARALMWVGRNREYSIACNGLVNKLAKIQLEIPHVVYSVPSEVNYLADIFSRAFTTSRFLEKAQFALSKTQANALPPLTEPFCLTESALYRYFALPLIPERDDQYPRKKPKVSTPKPISNLYKLFKDCTPEEKYLSALRLLQGWNDSSLRDDSSVEANTCMTGHGSANFCQSENGPGPLRPLSQPPEAKNLLKAKSADLYKLYTDRVMKKTLDQLYGDLDSVQQKRIEATLRENQKSLYHQNLNRVIKDDFVKYEVEKASVQKTLPDFSVDDKAVPIRYSVIRPSCFHPVKRDDSPGIEIPIQDEVTLPPDGQVTVDTGIQLVIPPTLCVRFIPMDDLPTVNVSIHPGVVDENFSSTIKLQLSNAKQHDIRLEAGTALVQAVIHHVIHPTLVHKRAMPSHPTRMTESTDNVCSLSSLNLSEERPENEDEKDSSLITSSYGRLGCPEPIREIELGSLPTSYMHMVLDEKFPSCLQAVEINTAINLPCEIECNSSTIAGLAPVSQSEQCVDDQIIPIPHPNPDTESLVQIYPSDLQTTVSTQTSESSREELHANPAANSAYNSMCEKLAVVSVDLIQNGSMSRSMLAQLQQGDDYLGPIRDEMGKKDHPFPKYVIKDMILYKKFKPKHSLSEKFVLCLPDVLLPAVIHFLHVQLGHPSVTVTRRNFELYYQNRNAHRMISSYVQACVTCALAQKYDLKKVMPETQRSLRPTRPRQYMYCDLIPMPGKVYTYILFCLDAYSQFVYALALKDKTSGSIIQGFINLFSSTGGWPEAIYLDNETSFQKSAKFLVKKAPVKILYSVPYCQFQNWSENYIKNFKKTLSKILHDVAAPHNGEDWPLLLPTVTQSLNRQVIPDIGLTRESIHFNMNVEFHPLAHLGSEYEAMLADEVKPMPSDIFQKILERRMRNRKAPKRNPIPHFHETQVVFMRDQAPHVGSVLKAPNKGPFRIDKLEERNVLLTDLATGKTVQSHIQFIRPLELSEYRLLLSKNWDLNVNAQRANMPTSHAGIFDAPMMPYPIDSIIEQEKLHDFPEEGELENIFHEPVDEFHPDPSGMVNSTSDAVSVPPAPKPPDISLERSPVPLRRSPRFTENDTMGLFSVQADLPQERDQPSAERDLGEEISFNAVNIDFDVSKQYRKSLGYEPCEIGTNVLPGVTEIEITNLSQKSALKKKRSISFYLPSLPPYLFFPEKDEEINC